MSERWSQAFRESGYLDEGFAERYERFRPAPPAVVLDALERYAGGPPLALVIDLGSGTGLSTRAWAERAKEVVGVEPNPEMRRVAGAQTARRGVRYLDAFAQRTGLPSGSADLVTCSQSFHWMDRAAVLAEAARILRPGGVFAAYDYDAIPVVHPRVEAAWEEFLLLRARYRDELGMVAGWTRDPKAEHLEAIRASGHFSFARELVLHDEWEAGAEDLIGYARSLGLIPQLLARGATEEQLGLTALDEAIQEVLGAGRLPCLVGYRVRLGVR
ncbi:MAG TPA: class I SAM-dependent methyltransferase [Gaiellaceae bacterium]|jgi:SAM-dependent methyltransferase|nr:class I SAM-dependent methyltransferase [Gaiellaceae bacterium]